MHLLCTVVVVVLLICPRHEHGIFASQFIKLKINFPQHFFSFSTGCYCTHVHRIWKIKTASKSDDKVSVNAIFSNSLENFRLCFLMIFRRIIMMMTMLKYAMLIKMLTRRTRRKTANFPLETLITLIVKRKISQEL